MASMDYTQALPHHYTVRLLLGLLQALACAEPELKKWYHDPYFTVRQALPNCPRPLGPYTSEAEMKQQAHWRAERGTSCWLAGRCQKANAYLYDADIAADLQRRFAASHAYAQASLWLTVQRRFVYVEGCMRDRRVLRGLEAFVRRTPDVELVNINVMQGSQGKPPYAVRVTD